jgi:hypothetical protein
VIRTSQNFILTIDQQPIVYPNLASGPSYAPPPQKKKIVFINFTPKFQAYTNI